MIEQPSSPDICKKIDVARTILDKLNWPQVVHSTTFACDAKTLPLVAKRLGYKQRPCPDTPDGIWRTKNGSAKAFVVYERIEKNGQF